VAYRLHISTVNSLKAVAGSERSSRAEESGRVAHLTFTPQRSGAKEVRY
jgi:hypothetical protein